MTHARALHGRTGGTDWQVLQRTLPGTAAAARLARVTARVACRSWRVAAVEDAAALVASELVTTVLRHTDGGALTLRVLLTPDRLRLEVHDPSGRLPPDVAAASDDDATAMTVVGATAARWGAETGASVQLWAEIAL